MTPIKAIKAKCLDCCCNQQNEVKLCTAEQRKAAAAAARPPWEYSAKDLAACIVLGFKFGKHFVGICAHIWRHKSPVKLHSFNNLELCSH
mgnify:CR=1 FL=1